MISVVITAYNVAEYLERAIYSVINQTYKDLEIIIVNDCSPDSCKEIIEKLQKEDSRIVLIDNKENVGAGLSRRYGIEVSKGEYVMLLDGDDEIVSDYIQKLYDKAVEYNADIVSGGVKIVNDDGTSYDYAKKSGIYQNGIEKINNEFDKTTVAFLNNKIVRRSLYDIVPYCDRRFIEDTPVLMKLLYYANKSIYLDYPGYIYYQRNQSLIHSKKGMEYFIFNTLFTIDCIEFFKDKEEEYRERFPYSNFRMQYFCKKLNSYKDEELTSKFPKEWKQINEYKKYLESIDKY